MTNRPPTTACGTLRVTETYRDHTTYARREHTFGKVRSLADEARTIGEPSLLGGVAVLALCLFAGCCAAVFWGAF